jgi:hypothetical protein
MASSTVRRWGLVTADWMVGLLAEDLATRWVALKELMKAAYLVALRGFQKVKTLEYSSENLMAVH